MLGIIGRHLTVDMYGCIFESFDNVDFVKETLLTAVSEANMTLLNFTYHKFEPQGLTVLALLAEGHISIHTYPNINYTAVDVFIYGDQSHPEQAVRVLRHGFRPEKIKTTNIKRGDFGSISDMKPKMKLSITPMRRVRDTGEKVFRFLSRSK
jgi:S-adenosylmethionine decarboxylase